MTMFYEERPSDSPLIESITRGETLSAGSTIRPAESHWHMVFVKEHGNFHPIVVGALPSAGLAAWGAGAEILWIKFKLGAFMPHLPMSTLLNREQPLSEATGQAFWLKSSTWQCPDFDNVEIFVNRLVRNEILVHDPVVNAALQELPHRHSPHTLSPHTLAPRTLRHRFLRATGLTYSHIRQFERAQQAAAHLRQGHSILDTVAALGNYDQPHLTRSLKRFVGHTPAQLSAQAPS